MKKILNGHYFVKKLKFIFFPKTEFSNVLFCKITNLLVFSFQWLTESEFTENMSVLTILESKDLYGPYNMNFRYKPPFHVRSFGQVPMG